MTMGEALREVAIGLVFLVLAANIGWAIMLVYL